MSILVLTILIMLSGIFTVMAGIKEHSKGNPASAERLFMNGVIVFMMSLPTYIIYDI